MPETSITTNDIRARPAVTARLPVAVAPQGRSPRKLQNRMKKKSVRMYGRYFSPPCPIAGRTMSSRTKITIASMAVPKPPGARFSR